MRSTRKPTLNRPIASNRQVHLRRIRTCGGALVVLATKGRSRAHPRHSCAARLSPCFRGVPGTRSCRCAPRARCCHWQHRIDPLDGVFRVDPVGGFDRVVDVGPADALLPEQLLLPEQAEQHLDRHWPERSVGAQSPAGRQVICVSTPTRDVLIPRLTGDGALAPRSSTHARVGPPWRCVSGS